ncbi:cation:proton antiporter [Mariprofundus ferrooxydans]|uniref:Potassium efflux system protein n=1 Tax=Mariprofundus ferrooxydans PV-1 TaxID=314345 RepID=Q0EX72_9PROT|nr:monovalent cation:proton antiporter-2 (CPA2) family protein [Mariprofundus ferrooxydans]EAU53918.1 Potassium efflux system protein [Mariprofundus ferrooxydans PV-1]KON48332.1 potassium transporter [Mariprofundus ferrooxydans]
MEYSSLNDTLIMLVATVFVVVLFLRIGMPPVLAYLVVGITVGPYGLGLVYDVEQIRVLAEFGVVLLLFTIGLEFSASLLMHMKAAVLGLGSAQVLFTAAVTTAAAVAVGLSLESALVLGGVLAMSSTALVTKQLADQVELQTRHGRNSLGILLFQDLMVVPFLILVAMLSGTTGQTTMLTVLKALAEGVAVLLLMFAFGRWVLRPLFREVARFHSAELFTLTVLLVVLCSAWLTHQIGLTFALGAFLAGVMLSETEFRHQVESEIRPFRDVLLGLFFITVGMMLDLSALPDVWRYALALLALLIVFKLLIVAAFCRLGGWNSAVSLRTGLILAHGGEFGFAILILAMEGDILRPDEGQSMLAAMLLSMMLAPLLIRYNGIIATRLLPKAVKQSQQEIRDGILDTARTLNRHVIVCGFGRVGQHTLNLLLQHRVPCMAIELEPVMVRQGTADGKPVSFGDAGSLELLHACGLSRASALVISMIDFNTAMKIISRVRAVEPDLPIIVRTRKEMHLFQFYQAGATEVVADTFGSDQMITAETLARFGLGDNEGDQPVRQR